MIFSGWSVERVVDGDGQKFIHIVPIDDIKAHNSTDCWCEPLVELDDSDDYIIIHRSGDGREQYETIN